MLPFCIFTPHFTIHYSGFNCENKRKETFEKRSISYNICFNMILHRRKQQKFLLFVFAFSTIKTKLNYTINVL